ncbi:MAG: sodium/solute symporter, partial [Planctomycetia bacterium]|nr:sodium/solute symporter [Planctomycetia bacterium]
MKRFILLALVCLSATAFGEQSEPVGDESNGGAPTEAVSKDEPPTAPDSAGFLQWRVDNEVLPLAVARPFFGVMDSPGKDGATQKNICLMGGSYFDKPRNEGGKKHYSADVYILDPQEKEGKKSWAARRVAEALPEPCAEGISINFKGGLLLCGGVTPEGESKAVWLAAFDSTKNQLKFEPMPDLPIPCSMGCGGVIRDNSTASPVDIPYVYAHSRLFALDKNQWVELEPIPYDKENGVERNQAAGAVRVSNGDATSLFVFGGCDSAKKDRPLFDVWKMHPTRENGALKSNWTRLPDLEYEGEKFCTIGATAVPLGAQSIVLVGGVNSDIWTEVCEKLAVLSGAEREAYLAEYFARSEESFRWEKRLFVYHTVIEQGVFFEGGKVKIPTPVCGAAVVYANNELIVAGGEVKPATRTKKVQTLNLRQNRQFGWANWMVFLGYLGLMLPFGFFFMRRNKGTNDYFKGGGKIPWWVTGVAIFAAMLSSITFMTIPAMTFSSSWRLFPMAISILILAPIVIHFYLPFFRKLEITSAYEYLERRFNVFSRVFASMAFILFMIVRSAIVVYLPALALSVIIGMNLYVSIILVGTVTVIYSTIGGVSAVIWSEFIQAVVLVGGALLAMVLLIHGTDGGVCGVWNIALTHDKFHLFDFDWSWVEPVFWITFVGGIATNLSSYTSDQTIVQKYMTTKDEKSAAHSIWFNGILSFMCSTLFYFIGTCLYAYYKSNAASFDWGLYQNDAIFPTYIVSSMPPGVSGILIAAIFAAAMSTLSANFNSASTAFVTDFYRRFVSDDEQTAFRMAKSSAFVFGVMAIGFALLIATIDIKSLFMEFQKVIGILTSGLAGLFVMGIFIPRINGIGAVAGLAASYVVNIILIYSQFIPHKPHFLLYSVAGLLACVVVGYVVSLFTGRPEPRQLDGLT